MSTIDPAQPTSDLTANRTTAAIEDIKATIEELNAADAIIMRKTVKTVTQILPQRRSALREGNIEKLVDIFLEGEERLEVDEDIDLENAKLRATYFSDTKPYTAAEIRAFRAPGKMPKNKSEPASRWKRENRIFAIRKNGVDYFPRFQFVDGAPLPLIKKVLKQLPDDMTQWQIAFWFASGNGWLDGIAPQDALGDEEGVLLAAQRMRETAIG